MTTGKNILTAKNVNFPHRHILADLSTLTYKWDQVPVNEWTEYADKYIWAKRQGYTHISAYLVSDWISEEGRREIDTIVNDQWFRID